MPEPLLSFFISPAFTVLVTSTQGWGLVLLHETALIISFLNGPNNGSLCLNILQ